VQLLPGERRDRTSRPVVKEGFIQARDGIAIFLTGPA
jgi:hypothetical protein